MQFINAIPEDLPEIVEIYNSTIASRMVTADTEPVTVADKLAWFNAHNKTTRPLWMVKDHTDKTIGWVSYNNFYGRPAYDGTSEISIYLEEGERQKGYGKLILRYCINMAPSLKIHTLLGFIFSHNEPSIRLFMNEGFEEWGLLKDIAVMDDQRFSLSIVGLKI
jgi:phosphinothricin acetyltransferase